MGAATSKNKDYISIAEQEHFLEPPPAYTEVHIETQYEGASGSSAPQNVIIGRLGEIITNEATPCMYCKLPIGPNQLRGVCPECTEKLELARTLMTEDQIPWERALRVAFADIIDYQANPSAAQEHIPKEMLRQQETPEERRARHAAKRAAKKEAMGPEAYAEYIAQKKARHEEKKSLKAPIEQKS
jgi:hypothetical protein